MVCTICCGLSSVKRRGRKRGKLVKHVLSVCLSVSVTQYFESDDPDLYMSKIQYIRENGVSDLELVFAEEEFSEDGTVRVRERGGEEGHAQITYRLRHRMFKK